MLPLTPKLPVIITEPVTSNEPVSSSVSPSADIIVSPIAELYDIEPVTESEPDITTD